MIYRYGIGVAKMKIGETKTSCFSGIVILFKNVFQNELKIPYFVIVYNRII